MTLGGHCTHLANSSSLTRSTTFNTLASSADVSTAVEQAVINGLYQQHCRHGYFFHRDFQLLSFTIQINCYTASFIHRYSRLLSCTVSIQLSHKLLNTRRHFMTCPYLSQSASIGKLSCSTYAPRKHMLIGWKSNPDRS